MLFTSLTFLLSFVPLFLIVYYGVGAFLKGKTLSMVRSLILTVGSLLFCAVGDLLSCVTLIFIALINYLFGIMTDLGRKPYKMQHAEGKKLERSSQRKGSMIFAVVFDAVFLFVFKYTNNIFAATSFELPQLLGVSYYIFSLIAYQVDVYRGEKAERSLLYFFADIAMFPKLLQGPITRHKEVRKDLLLLTPDYSEIEHGLGCFILGLFFQCYLSRNIGALWTTVWSYGPHGIGTLAAWFGAWGYSMQLFFDFMGYTMMALGIAEMMGIHLPENFDSPYASKTCAEFWRRWHMTLGRFFRDYIYIPLGGSRNGWGKLILATFVTWLATAVWHGFGWHFLLWGMFFFVFILIERLTYGKLFSKIPVVGNIYMLIIIPVSWMIFQIEDMGLLGAYLGRMFFIPVSGMPMIDSDVLFGFWDLFRQSWWMMLLCVIFATPYPRRLYEKFAHSWPVRVILLALFWFCLLQISKNGSNPFMYMNF